MSTTVTSCALLLAALPVFWLLFSQFGPEFTYVLLPLTLIALLAYRIHASRLEEKTREISEASRIHLATVEALATAIDARDQVGKGHVRRTQIYAVGIGRLMGLGESDINALRTGALLHDIGKLAVPDHILNKPGSLTPAELEKTKIHPSVGAAILDKVGFETPVVPTVKYHHEAWDGSGYPEGLKEYKIPLTARILAVADAFDTLLGARPYRPAMSRDDARKIMQAEAGTRFDPEIVRTLLRNLGLLESEIRAQGLTYEGSEGSESDQYFVEQIKLANREVFSLYELAREFSTSVNLRDTVDMFSRKIGEFVPYDTFSLYLLDESTRTAGAVHVEGDNSEALMDRRIKIGQGATGFALKTRETVHNVNPDLDFAYSQSELAGHYLTMASVPLVADDKLIGAATVYSSKLPRYGEENIRLLETISRIAANAIGKSLSHDEAKAHALTDPMTGLPNARSLQIHFDKEVARASRGDSSFQLLMLDLDGFKAVNDSFGHKTGDDLLTAIGNVIRGQLRDYDFLARYGGDEFVVLVPETSSADVVELCGRIEKSVGDYSLAVADDKSTSVGVSVGSAGYPTHGETFDQIIVAADKAMYDRKTERKRLTAAIPEAIRQEPEHAPQQHSHENLDSEGLIVELDETHVISSSAVN